MTHASPRILDGAGALCNVLDQARAERRAISLCLFHDRKSGARIEGAFAVTNGFLRLFHGKYMRPAGNALKRAPLFGQTEPLQEAKACLDDTEIRKAKSLLFHHELDDLKILLNAKRFDPSDNSKTKVLLELVSAIVCLGSRTGDAETLLLLLSNLDLSASAYDAALDATPFGEIPLLLIVKLQCLRYACTQGSVALAEFAASMPGRPFPEMVEERLEDACSAGSLNVLQYLLKHANPPPSLEKLTDLIFRACEKNQLETAKYLASLTSLEVDLHRPNTALSVACRHGHSDVVDWLLTLKVFNATAQSSEQNATRTTVAGKETPLLNACVRKDLALIKKLLTDNRFDIRQDPNGYAAAKRVAKDSPQLHALLQKYATSLPAHLLESSAEKHIAKIQLFTQAKKALEAIEVKRQIDFRKISEVRLPKITGFSEVVRDALLTFFETAYAAPYFILHTTSQESFPVIVKDGALLSKARLNALYPEIKTHGLGDSADHFNNEDYLVYAAMGTNPETLVPPSQFVTRSAHTYTRSPSITLNVDAWHRYNPTSQSSMVVKGYDWRETKQQAIVIKDTGISITRTATSAATGIVDARATLGFVYENTTSGARIEYNLLMLDEIAKGNNYRQLIPNLVVQHLRNLPESEQTVLLRGLIAAKQDKTLQQQASHSILEAFSTLECSIAGSLPLRLEYVDNLVEHGYALDLSALRNAVQAGAADEVEAFIKNTWPDSQSNKIPHWIIVGVHDIAMENWRWASAQQRMLPSTPAPPNPSQSRASTSAVASSGPPPADCYLAILDLVELPYQEAMRSRISGIDPVWTARDLMSRLDALNEASVSPSQVNQLIRHLKQDQPALKSYLSDRQEFVQQSLKAFRGLFSSIHNVSDFGLQSSLKSRVIANPKFREFVSTPEHVKVLLYLAAASPTLVQEVIGEQNPLLFESVNLYTRSGSLLGLLTGVRLGNSLPVNDSILADLLFNVPPTALFVPANGNQSDHDEVTDYVLAADTSRLFYGALHAQFREAKLSAPEQTLGERLLQERYDSGQWSEYQKRYGILAQLAEGKSLDDPRAHSSGSGVNPVGLIENLAVLQPDFVHYNLDARHLQAILGGDYGGAKSTIESLIEIVAVCHSENEKYETTATQLFHRLKLLEFEFYKENLIGHVQGAVPSTAAVAAWDAYAGEIIKSSNLL
jgi:hypothetical protein